MAKVKYYYDSENLAYRKIITKTRKKIGVVLLFLVASALFGFLSVVFLLNTPYFETPKNRLQKREIENLKLRYAILNKKMDQVFSNLLAVVILLQSFTGYKSSHVRDHHGHLGDPVLDPDYLQYKRYGLCNDKLFKKNLNWL